MKHLPRIIAALIFTGLLSTPFLIRKYYDQGAAEVDNQTALERYGFYFEEVSKQSGIEFVHASPTLDAKLSHIMPIIASMGAAVSIVDFDRDGWNDIYVTNSGEGSLNALYRNNGDGTFTDVASELGIADVNRVGTGVSMGAVWGDFDNSGYEDLLLYKWGKTELYRNNGGHSFSLVDTAGFPEWANINTAIWFDYDNDGLLDIFLGGYFHEDINLWKLDTTLMMPESFEYARNGGRKFLFRNLGDGRFEDVTRKMGIESNRWALAAAAADLTGNGYPDLFIANDYGVSELYFNDGGRQFQSVGDRTGVGFSPKSGMNASFGDVMNDGRLSIYVSNISEEGILLQGNNLWVPRPNTHGTDLRYDNQANNFGVELGGWSWAAQFGDLNNNGNLDLFLTNGYISADKTANYWYDYSKVTVGHNRIIGDAANWPEMAGRSLAGFQQKKVWVNDGAGRFNEVALAVGVRETYDGRAVAVADLWNRGVLDVVVANQNGPLLVYRNTVDAENSWIGFELEGTLSNRSAIGTRVTLFWDGKLQMQEVRGGEGYCSQNQRRVHFGLGRVESVDRVEIRWPSGRTRVIERPEVNSLHKMTEGG
jgi:enediyne biosynthesis protein E4